MRSSLGPLRAVELRRLRLPLVEPWRTALGVVLERDVCLVRTVFDGAEGWGECVAMGDPSYSPEYTEGAVDVLRRHLLPGLLTASGLVTAAENNGRPTDLFDYLSEKDPSGFKYRLPFEQQVEMYRFVIDRLDRKRIVPALCKEDVSVWKAVGLEFDGCHCLPRGSDVPGEILSNDSHARVSKGAG